LIRIKPMEVLFLLIPMSAVLVFVILGVFASAIAGGQFDNLEVEGERILAENAPADHAKLTGSHEPEQPARD
jgi:cbb3-type cytochrome oxidase maturation protein